MKLLVARRIAAVAPTAQPATSGSTAEFRQPVTEMGSRVAGGSRHTADLAPQSRNAARRREPVGSRSREREVFLYVPS